MSAWPRVADRKSGASAVVGGVVAALILTGANPASAEGLAEEYPSVSEGVFRVAVGADDPDPFVTDLDRFDQVGPQDDKQSLLTLAPLTSDDKLWAETQEPLGDAAALIQTKFPADYAYAYFSDLKLVIGFANDAPHEAEQTLAQTGLPFEIAENVGFSEIAYIDAVGRLSGAFSETVPDGVYFTVAPTPNVSPGRILATFSSNVEVLADRDDIANALLGSDVGSPFFLDIESFRHRDG